MSYSFAFTTGARLGPFTSGQRSLASNQDDTGLNPPDKPLRRHPVPKSLTNRFGLVHSLFGGRDTNFALEMGVHFRTDGYSITVRVRGLAHTDDLVFQTLKGAGPLLIENFEVLKAPTVVYMESNRDDAGNSTVGFEIPTNHKEAVFQLSQKRSSRSDRTSMSQIFRRYVREGLEREENLPEEVRDLLNEDLVADAGGSS